MDDRKVLTDEELEKVIGGVGAFNEKTSNTGTSTKADEQKTIAAQKKTTENQPDSKEYPKNPYKKW